MLILASWLASAQQPPPKPPEPDLPEEDTSITQPKVYDLNPIQAETEFQRGMYYFKKKSYKGASMRFDEATKWDPGLSKAWLKLGESLEKLNDKKGARAAYQKYLELEPDARDADSIRKKINAKS
jgi:tetratricopeptide (TPR) repeat protein